MGSCPGGSWVTVVPNDSPATSFTGEESHRERYRSSHSHGDCPIHGVIRHLKDVETTHPAKPNPQVKGASPIFPQTPTLSVQSSRALTSTSWWGGGLYRFPTEAGAMNSPV